jgi:amino acid adenylation domain-containing protein
VDVPATGDQLAYAALTSGSTGTPKVVLGRHAALSQYGSWLAAELGVGASDRCSLLTSLSHDPLLRDVLGPLQVGATVCIPDPSLFDRPGALAEWADSERLTVANVTPAMARLLLEGADRRSIPSLRYALLVGEPLFGSLVGRLTRLAPSATCVNLYGATETQQALARFLVPPSAGAESDALVPVGRGMPGVDVLVMGDERRQAGVGEVGDVWIRSPLLARGYLHDADLTAARFRHEPLGPGSGRVYRTGDRGRYLPTGDVVLHGRLDTQVKIRGHRIEVEEIEAALLGDADVVEAAVTAISAPDGESRLVAFIAGVAIDLPALRRRARARVPEYMVPGEFVHVDRLPRTATGKIDRRALDRLPREGAESERVVAPRNEIEARLLALWTEVLGLSTLSIEDGFFDVGGHSILAARAVSRMREDFSIDLTLTDLFTRPRISQMAELVADAVAARDAEVGRLIAEVQGLSPEELAAILEEAGLPEGGGVV